MGVRCPARASDRCLRSPCYYGLVVYLYFYDEGQHHEPHVHVKYQGEEAALRIPDGEVLDGTLPRGKLKLAQAWMEIHAEELEANWALAAAGEPVFKIDPLR
ncbi:DUF4160 domain-containing protein [Rubrivirga sp. S365]|uniref:DUF4160 domain-containing protein n=1 Tax=Rubrivirga litoralis TaxID=3075598 RepID=A0ABU3BNS0_9BACT|nr:MULTISPECIES: DUF4160 domain-containing protein [unclassified Rubrivirga]MDT0630937.1 DUF4160 domain-containing protein [Rubrivirga sp. F394]MDT7856580.1 DUF4160 domain-containing protein [Rubrivirga sp. S365]